MRYARFGCILASILFIPLFFLHPATARAETEVSGHIKANTTWTLAGSPYIVTENVTVRHATKNGPTATLTIESGVVVKFNAGKGLFIGYYSYGAYHGALSAQGSDVQPIIFTSNADTPAPGDWKGIRFTPTTDDANTSLQHCVVEYGGNDSTYEANISCHKSSPSITNSTIRHSSRYGIDCDDDSFPSISTNDFVENSASAIVISPDGVKHLTQNTGSGNGVNAIEVRGGHLVEDATWTKQDLPYLISGNLTVRHATKNDLTTTLTLAPQVMMKFAAGTGLYIGYYSYGNYYGALSAVGTDGQPITFTSSADPPAPGDWRGIRFTRRTDADASSMQHCVVEYGGRAYDANVSCVYTDPTIANSTIQYSSGYGIHCDDDAFPVLSNNTISDNTDSPVSLAANGVKNLAGNSGSGNGEDAIRIRGSDVTEDATWVRQTLPYVVEGDVTVRYSTKNGSTATLTIEPGVTIKFEPGKGLLIGWYSYGSYYGALSARGTVGLPITFTSNACIPAPGDWKGIYFRKETEAAASVLEHCVVEYGGHAHDANIYCRETAPTITKTQIRAGSQSGIYLYGNPCNDAVVTCNNLSQNRYGITLANSAACNITNNNITNNNFIRNSDSGLNASGGATVNAVNNWWNDANGPNQSGDAASGSNLVTIPWRDSPSDCIAAPPDNLVPIVPNRPDPQNSQTNVPLINAAVELNWCGGDPNPSDSLTYEIFWGTAANDLAKVDETIDTLTYTKDNLVVGNTYFWQIKSRDPDGAVSPGAVWQFSIQNDPPSISNLGTDGQGNGTSVALDWSGYDETVHGNVDHYAIYVQAADFSEVGALTVSQTVAAGHFSALVSGLTTGSTYWFAVVPVDPYGNYQSTVTAASAMPTDVTPPGEVSNLQVQSLEETLTFTWEAPADTAGDLAGYKVYFDGSPTPDLLPAAQPVYTADNLDPASFHTVDVTTYDTAGNESAGRAANGITLLDNPANLIANASATRVDLSWNGVTPSQYVRHYAIYTSLTSFSSVTGMSPLMTAAGTSAILSGLENNQTYFVAVTTVNQTGGEQQTVAAVETEIAAPAIVSVTANHASPVKRVDDFQLTIRFNTAMDPGIEPTVAMTSSPGSDPVFPAGGTWLTTFEAADTYVTPAIELAGGMDGTIATSLSDATDTLGNVMDPAADVFSFDLDATPPAVPAFSVSATTCDTATVDWSGYSAPADLAGFRLYLEEHAFTSLEGLIPVTRVGNTRSSYPFGLLALDTTYHAAVGAIDATGNLDATASPVEILIPRVVPPPVSTLQVLPGIDPGEALLSWDTYDGENACGLDGFWVFSEPSDFASVNGLTPVAALAADARSHLVEGLNRQQTRYFAVVGFNDAGSFNPDVAATAWSDPYGGDVSVDLTLGSGEQTVIDIHHTLTIKSGATLTVAAGTTLYFAAGSGIVVESGALAAEGTALDPIVFTSATDTIGQTPQPGDWNGISLQADASGSILEHVFIRYGQGLWLTGCSPTIEAFSALFNTPAGLNLDGNDGASLITASAFICYNHTGVRTAEEGYLEITDSVIRNNDVNAAADGHRELVAQGNWWGAPDGPTILTTLSGEVDHSQFLDHEPLLTPAMGTPDGTTVVGSPEVTLRLACRTAEEMRLSEDSSFTGVFFEPFLPEIDEELSPGGGLKQIFAQFKSATGAVSAPISIDITYVTDGPQIQTFNLNEGQAISRPLTVNATATAALGMDALDFYVDDALVSSTGGGSLSTLWDVRDLTNGTHRAKLVARDVAGNLATSQLNVNVGITPPPAPVLTQPAGGIISDATPVRVAGTAEPGVRLQVFRNGALVGDVTAAADGSFEMLAVAIHEGPNAFHAQATDRVSVSALSNEIRLVLDSELPAPVILLAPEFVVGEGVVLQWQYSQQGERPSSFAVYRQDAFFADADDAIRIQNHLSRMTWMDDDLQDGTYYYGVVGKDGAANASLLSNVVSVACDHTDPAFDIVYAAGPPVGAGPLQVTLTASETLVDNPTLTITPHGTHNPETVGLSLTAERTYVGTYTPTAQTPSGEARVRVSGRDVFGNVFSGAPSGAALIIDTAGPQGAIDPALAEPVQVTQALALDITLTLNEPAASPPTLSYTPPVGAVEGIDLAGAGTDWSGTLSLDPDMGTGTGHFMFQAQDLRGNVGTDITAGEYLEIYTTATPPPPSAPMNATARAMPGGDVALAWNPVAKAEAYRIYRADGACPGSLDTPVADNLITPTYSDHPPADGPYCYGVTALRLGVESDMSDLLAVTADATPPDVPENLGVSLGTDGIWVQWEPPAQGQAPDSYHLFRNDSKIRQVPAGPGAGFSILDHPPRGGQYSYTVASVDDVGNENPCDPVILDLTVGAVDELQVTLDHGTFPVIEWRCDEPDVAGFHVYRGDTRLTPTALTQTRFVDQSYAGDCMVRYRVVAVNAAGTESPPRSVELFPVLIQGVANPDTRGESQDLVGGFFNRFRSSVANLCGLYDLPLASLHLEVTAEGIDPIDRAHPVDQAIAQAAAYEHDFVFPCAPVYEPHLLQVTAVQTDPAGNTVSYRRTFAHDGVLRPEASVEVSIEDLPLAGGEPKVRLCIRNNGHTATDIVANRENGAEPGDIHVTVRNGDGLEISRGQYNGIPSGSRKVGDVTLVTLQPGQTLCVDVKVLVPADLAPGDEIYFEGVVDQLFHAYGSGQEQISSGLAGGMLSGITHSEYYGTADVVEEAYMDGAQIVITGQAIDRATGDPLADTELKVGFLSRGYHWFDEFVKDENGLIKDENQNPIPLKTDQNGNYTQIYTPPPGLSGEVTVWAAHPDVYDILDQDRFHIYRLYCTPAAGEIRMSKADSLGFRVELYNPDEIPVTLARVDFMADDGKGNPIDPALLSGGSDFGGEIIELSPGEKRYVDLQLSAAGDAPDTAGAQYSFVTTAGAVAVFSATLKLLPAVPLVAVVTPAAGYVDVSMDRGTLHSQTVTVSNMGLADLTEVVLTPPQEFTWMTTNLKREADGRVLLGDLAVGASKSFDVVFAPPADTPFGYHQDSLTLEGSNSEQVFRIQLYARVTSNLTGAVQFSVRNILDQKLEGATIRMRNGLTRQEIAPVKTDADGAALIADIPEGEWSWQVAAPGHSSDTGVVSVIADQTAATEALLLKALVTIEFSVEPVPFTDRYEIKIEQTFETHVQAPVLVVDPPKVQFDNVTGPFEIMIDVSVKNFGLIKLHDVSVGSQSAPWGSLEPLIDFLPELGAMQEIVIPYRLTFHGQVHWDDLVAQSVAALGGRSPERCGEIPSGLFPPSDPKKPTANEIIDCLTGLGGLLNAMATMQSLLQGCYKCVNSNESLAVMGTMAAVIIGSGTGDPASFLANAMICFAQAFLNVSFSRESDGNYKDGRRVWGGWSYDSDVACFAAGTPILMADGSLKPIETIAAGDRVMSFDGRHDTVKRIYHRTSDHERELVYRNPESGELRRLLTTDGHLFWVQGKKWVPAAELAPGDLLMMGANTTLRVETNQRFERPVEVYNFDVHEYRSYFAGGVLVHEKCGSIDDDPLSAQGEW